MSQTCNTGEVAKAREDLIEAIGELAAEGYSLGMAEGSDLPDHLEIKSLAASRDESREECVSAIDKFGAACFAAGRAVAGNCEPTDDTEYHAGRAKRGASALDQLAETGGGRR